MPGKPPRTLRRLRITYRRLLRRLDRRTPEWMRWLTPWGTSLSLHALAFLVLAILYFARAEAPARPGLALAGQLRDDVTSLRDADQAGDPFATLEAAEPPSISFKAPRDDAAATNVPELPPTMLLGPELRLDPPSAGTPPPAPKAQGRAAQGRGAAKGEGEGTGLFAHGSERTAPFSGRRADQRAKLLRREGGTAQSEEAVERGLDWLARHQRPDGAWSLDTSPMCDRQDGCPPRNASASDAGATGLALLPFLAAGHTHTEKGRYQDTVLRGLRWLVKHQHPTGDFYQQDGMFNSAFYSHAIASMVVCEAYGLTGDKRLRDPAQKAIKFIVLSQNKFDGGWRYFLGMPGDTSVFGWEIFALRSASLAGLDVPRGTVRRCATYLNLAATDPSRTTYAYLPGRAATATMTAQGLLVRQYLGWPRDHPSLLTGAALVVADLEASEERNIYYWYYATQLLHNMQGKAWRDWNARVRDGLVGLQVRGKGCDRGSWDPMLPEEDRWGRVTGRLFTTAMSLLTLEVYYRYLPLYQVPEGEMAVAEGQDPAPAAAP